MVYVFYDYRAPEKIREGLIAAGFIPLEVRGSDGLSEAVHGHADLNVLNIGKTLVVRREVAEYYPALLSCEGVVVSDEMTKAQYPDEAKFCAKVAGETLYHGKVVADDVLRVAEAEGLSCQMIRQGYVACNLLVVDASHAITSDASVAKALSLHGVEVLQIRDGFVSLPPYPYGFIGGASGVYRDIVYFLGDVMRHPDGERMVAFITSCEKNVVSLSRGELFDGGGLVFFESELPLTVGENAKNNSEQRN